MATSPSTRDEGLDTDRSEGDFADSLENAEPHIQSIISPNGFKEFIMLPIWTINDFISTIKQTHFKILREKYQIPVNIPLCLPYQLEMCYYESVDGVGIYEQMMKAGLKFPLSALHRCLLQYLGLAIT